MRSMACLLLLGCADAAVDGPAVDIWVADVRAGLFRFDGEGAPVATGVSLPDGWAPTAVLPEPDGAVVADFASGAVWRFGARAAVLHPGSSAEVPIALRLEETCALSREGEVVWALGNDSGNLVRIAPDGMTALGLTEPLPNAHSFARVGEDVVVGMSPRSPGAGLLQRRSVADDALEGDYAPWPVLEEATAVLVLPDGGLLVADWFGDRIALFTADGEPEGTFADETDGLDSPVALSLGPDGAVWSLDRRGVTRWGPLGPVRVVDSAAAGLVWPRGLSVVAAP